MPKETNSTKIIAVVNTKGGSGKTSTAVHLAWIAAQRHKTLLLDLDYSCSALIWTQQAKLEDRLDTLHIPPLEVPNKLEGIISVGREEYQYIFIDTPAGLSNVAMSAMEFADMVLIPIHIGSGDVGQLGEVVSAMRMPLKINPKIVHRVVVNHAGTMKRVTKDTKDVVTSVGLVCTATDIPFRSEYAVAKGGVPKGIHYDMLWTELRGLLDERA